MEKKAFARVYYLDWLRVLLGMKSLKQAAPVATRPVQPVPGKA